MYRLEGAVRKFADYHQRSIDKAGTTPNNILLRKLTDCVHNYCTYNTVAMYAIC